MPRPPVHRGEEELLTVRAGRVEVEGFTRCLVVAGGFEAEPAVRLFADGDLAVAGDAVALRVVGGQTQAFFTKVSIEEDDELRVENARPFEMLLDPEVNADALTWAANADKARTPALDSSG